MSHNGSNKAPGRPRTPYRKQRNRLIQSQKKSKRQAKRKRQREKWANDKEYQAQQQIRLERLQSKAGYSANIERGQREKKEYKQLKIKRRRERVNQNRMHQMRMGR